MKKTYLLLVLSVFLLSCNKEDESLIAKYQTVYGFWKTQTVSYDSSGVTVISTPYNRLSIKINDDLTYKIFQDSVNNIENGSIKILMQTNYILEMNFTPDFPNYSSIAGSHIFSTANVILISLTDNEMVLSSVENGNLPVREFRFKKP